jgi:hypothetical protein
MTLNERDTHKDASNVTKQVYDVLVYGAFTALSDAWKRDPDPTKISWVEDLPRHLVGEPLGYGSVEACQKVVDKMTVQISLLTICGETCVVKKDVIAELKLILGR